ncbi:MAG: S41 family peptidase [Acidobacteria bacterium]|nr:S41 family peptidase [Acidobacteriota bacterium]
MLANELSVSGGDELAYYFKFLKLGPLVGTRTAGGMIGNGGQFPVTGGWNMAIPQFGFFSPVTGEWVPENRGVEPDHKVELTPAACAAGRDPQLEKAIDLALEALKTYKKQLPETPPYRPSR